MEKVGFRNPHVLHVNVLVLDKPGKFQTNISGTHMVYRYQEHIWYIEISGTHMVHKDK